MNKTLVMFNMSKDNMLINQYLWNQVLSEFEKVSSKAMSDMLLLNIYLMNMLQTNNKDCSPMIQHKYKNFMTSSFITCIRNYI